MYATPLSVTPQTPLFRGNAAPADTGHLCSAGSTGHILAVPVFYDDLVGVMAVPVQESIDPAGMCDHILIGPGTAVGFVAQVSHDNDIVRSFSACRIYRCLNGVINAFARRVLLKAVYKFPIFFISCSLPKQISVIN